MSVIFTGEEEESLLFSVFVGSSFFFLLFLLDVGVFQEVENLLFSVFIGSSFFLSSLGLLFSFFLVQLFSS